MTWTLLLLACSENNVNQQANERPLVTIQSPEDALRFAEGATVDFRALISDPNGLEDVDSLMWTSSIDGDIGGDTTRLPDSEGYAVMSAVLSPGEHAITLTATDSGGLTGTDTLQVNISNDGEAPTVELLSPQNLDDYLDTETVEIIAIVTDGQQDPDSLRVYVRADDGQGTLLEISEPVPSASGSVRVEWVEPPAGTWNLIVEAWDDQDNIGVADAGLVIIDADGRDQDSDGWTVGEGDCDDLDGTANPGLPEVCGNGKDDDCSGVAEDKDIDNDGHIDDECTTYTGTLPVDDCDDNDVTVNPDEWDDPDLDVVDSNCDGLDGDIAKSVFIDPIRGDNSNTGLTPDAPVATLNKSLNKAYSEGRSWVLISGTGVSATESTFKAGISIAGGYDVDDGWSRNSYDLPTISVPNSGVLVDGWSATTEWQAVELVAADGSGTGSSSIALRVVDSTGLYPVSYTHLTLPTKRIV